jgi:ribonucleoside-diphosphate reductase alpha chain
MELSTEILSDITIHMKYARFVPELQRRETWDELVTRNKNMHLKKYPKLYKEINDAYQYVYDRKVLPSMRSLQFAGKPIDLNPARIYNCSFLPIDDPTCFAEAMFLLLSGVGVGYSVQRHHIDKLPEITKPRRSRRYLIADSIEGWADAVKVLIRAYTTGKPLPVFDFSDIRAKGALLVTSGGKAPGPEPLKECLDNIKGILDRKTEGEKLTSIEVHDICCFIADAVLAGGIRRSAMIALFDFDDTDMLLAKGNFVLPPVDGEITRIADTEMFQFYVEFRGQRISVALHESQIEQYQRDFLLPWYHVAPQRGRANNSAVILRHKIRKDEFLSFWKLVEASGAGEPGFMFSNDKEWGLNPCAEISLRPFQFCNLTTINASNVVDQEDLNNRAAAAALIGTLQAGYTNFHYLRDIWKKTTEKEALIGVSMTGIASGKVLELDTEQAAKIVLDVNARIAELIGTNKAARTTTVKPEGTTSLVLGSSSGIHAWHNDYYIRRLRVGKNESIYGYLAANHPDLIKDEAFRPNVQAVIEVPQKAPEGAITRHESAIDLLERVSKVWKTWVKTGHRKGANINNVSTTVTIKEEEWPKVGEWMWEHREEFTALSCLPHDSGTYIQAPFEDITEDKYLELLPHLSAIDLTQVVEVADQTTLQQEVACGGGGCTII